MVSVLFVCLGNICRSPAAEGIMRDLAGKNPKTKDVYVRSCGLGSWHTGQLPDLRMQEAAKKRGVLLSSRAQEFQPEFFEKFDFILAADKKVINVLYQHAKTLEHKAKIQMATAFSPIYKDQDIPDPYYGGEAMFELVLDMLEDACEGLLGHISLHSKT